MLPENMTLKPGEKHISISGVGLKAQRFSSLDELRGWAARDRWLCRLNMVLYFACDNSGWPHRSGGNGVSLYDDGTYVSIRAIGSGQALLDTFIQAVAAHEQWMLDNPAPLLMYDRTIF
jgi:hypothetical protein